MVELTLPKNSKIRTGKTWPTPEGGISLAKIAPKARVY
jgi:succinate dehydrogenase / fumarate reductase, iron-sulfur subunit